MRYWDVYSSPEVKKKRKELEGLSAGEKGAMLLGAGVGAGLLGLGVGAGVGYLAASSFGVAGLFSGLSKLPLNTKVITATSWGTSLLYPAAWWLVGAETSRRSLEYVGAWEQLGALSTERSLGYLAAQYQMYSALEAQRHANIVEQQKGAGMKDYQYRMYYNQSQGGYYYPRADSFGNAGMGW